MELELSASVAQLAEQLICNQQVVGSSPSASSRYKLRSGRKERVTGLRSVEIKGLRAHPAAANGGFPERSKGSDCKSDGNAFAGSNPAPPIKNEMGRPKSINGFELEGLFNSG